MYLRSSRKTITSWRFFNHGGEGLIFLHAFLLHCTSLFCRPRSAIYSSPHMLLANSGISDSNSDTLQELSTPALVENWCTIEKTPALRKHVFFHASAVHLTTCRIKSLDELEQVSSLVNINVAQICNTLLCLDEEVGILMSYSEAINVTIPSNHIWWVTTSVIH